MLVEEAVDGPAAAAGARASDSESVMEVNLFASRELP